MKKMKKTLALVLALVMALALAIPVMAAGGDYSITINNSTNENSSIAGKDYKAYKVFDLTLGNATTTGEGAEAVTTYGAYAYSIQSSDWAWSTLTTGATTDATTKVITTKYGITLTPSAKDATLYTVDGKSMTEANARALADALAKAGLPGSAAGSAIGGADQKATISLSEPGYYAVYGVVIPKDPKNQTAEEVVAALALTTTDPKADVIPKVEVPPLDKKITGEHVLDEAGKAATAEVGKTVSFQLDSQVPDLTGYTDYTFKITDTMTSGLTFTDPDGDATNDVVVKINNVDKTSDVRVVISDQTLTVTVPYSVLNAATKGQDITVTYSAVVNSKALTTDYEKNTANLEYSNNPTTDSTNKTPDKEVYVIDVDINVDKVAPGGSKKLQDAKFLVFKGDTQPADTAASWYKWDEANNKVTWVAKANADVFVTGADGKFTPNVRGLEAEATGTKYGLLETEAPEGYNLLKAPVIVTLTGTYTEDGATKTATVSSTGNTVKNGTVTLSAEQNANQPLVTTQVVNESGTELPSTGGIGTKIFYALGAVLVVGAGAVLVSRKRVAE